MALATQSAEIRICNGGKPIAQKRNSAKRNDDSCDCTEHGHRQRLSFDQTQNSGS